MKKMYAGLLASALLLLSACGGNGASVTETPSGTSAEPTQSQTKTITPLPSALDVNALEDCTFAASFTAGDVKLNDDGALVVTMTVYDYERFDLADVSALAEGDILHIDGQDVTVYAVQRDGQYVTVNGGIEAGGYDLYTEDNGVYFESLMDAGPKYYALGRATLPVEQEFVYTDNSDPENQGQVSYAGDFLMAMEDSDDAFAENATSVRVANGKIVEIVKNYIP